MGNAKIFKLLNFLRKKFKLKLPQRGFWISQISREILALIYLAKYFLMMNLFTNANIWEPVYAFNLPQTSSIGT